MKVPLIHTLLMVYLVFPGFPSNSYPLSNHAEEYSLLYDSPSPSPFRVSQCLLKYPGFEKDHNLEMELRTDFQSLSREAQIILNNLSSRGNEVTNGMNDKSIDRMIRNLTNTIILALDPVYLTQFQMFSSATASTILLTSPKFGASAQIKVAQNLKPATTEEVVSNLSQMKRHSSNIGLFSSNDVSNAGLVKALLKALRSSFGSSLNDWDVGAMKYIIDKVWALEPSDIQSMTVGSGIWLGVIDNLLGENNFNKIPNALCRTIINKIICAYDTFKDNFVESKEPGIGTIAWDSDKKTEIGKWLYCADSMIVDHLSVEDLQVLIEYIERKELIESEPGKIMIDKLFSSRWFSFLNYIDQLANYVQYHHIELNQEIFGKYNPQVGLKIAKIIENSLVIDAFERSFVNFHRISRNYIDGGNYLGAISTTLSLSQLRHHLAMSSMNSDSLGSRFSTKHVRDSVKKTISNFYLINKWDQTDKLVINDGDLKELGKLATGLDLILWENVKMEKIADTVKLIWQELNSMQKSVLLPKIFPSNIPSKELVSIYKYFMIFSADQVEDLPYPRMKEICQQIFKTYFSEQQNGLVELLKENLYQRWPKWFSQCLLSSIHLEDYYSISDEVARSYGTLIKGLNTKKFIELKLTNILDVIRIYSSNHENKNYIDRGESRDLMKFIRLFYTKLYQTDFSINYLMNEDLNTLQPSIIFEMTYDELSYLNPEDCATLMNKISLDLIEMLPLSKRKVLAKLFREKCFDGFDVNVLDQFGFPSSLYCYLPLKDFRKLNLQKLKMNFYSFKNCDLSHSRIKMLASLLSRELMPLDKKILEGLGKHVCSVLTIKKVEDLTRMLISSENGITYVSTISNVIQSTNIENKRECIVFLSKFVKDAYIGRNFNQQTSDVCGNFRKTNGVTCALLQSLGKGNVIWGSGEIELMNDCQFTRCIHYFGKHFEHFDQQVQQTIKLKLMRNVGTPSEWNSAMISDINSIITTLTLAQINLLNLTSFDVIYTLGQLTGWRGNGLRNVYTVVMSQNQLQISDLKPKHIHAFGNLICGMTGAEVQLIPASSIFWGYKALGQLSPSECSSEVLYYIKVIMQSPDILGPIKYWSPQLLHDASLVLSTITPFEWSEIHKSNLRYIQPKAMKGMSTHLMSAISTDSFEHLDPQQLSALSDNVVKSLDYYKRQFYENEVLGEDHGWTVADEVDETIKQHESRDSTNADSVDNKNPDNEIITDLTQDDSSNEYVDDYPEYLKYIIYIESSSSLTDLSLFSILLVLILQLLMINYL